jgi:hypothetical protein
MNKFTPEMLKQIPELYYSAGLAVSLQPATVESIETMGGADIESISGDPKVIVITFATEHDRNVFLEAVRFVQSHKSAEAK